MTAPMKGPASSPGSPNGRPSSVLGGLCAGGAAAVVLSRTVRGLFAEAASLHVGTLLFSTALLAVVAVLAAAAPAWRAARIDPARALQGE